MNKPFAVVPEFLSILFFCFCFCLMEVYLIYSVVLISAVHQSDSLIYTLLFMYYFHHGLLQDINYSSLCLYS